MKSKNFINKFGVLKTSLLASILSIIFVTFFQSSQFKSQVIISVASNKAPSVSQSLLGTFLGDENTQAFQIKSFLESKEASRLFEQTDGVTNAFQSKDIHYFSRYKPRFYKSFHDYYLKKVKVTIDSESNTIMLDTFAFTQNDALENNLKILNMTYDFLNRSARTAAYNAKIKKICNLYYVNSDVFSDEMLKNIMSSQSIPNVKSANELLLNKASLFRDNCISNVSLSNDSLVSLDPNMFPKYEVSSINADASKRILAEIYEDSINSIASSTEIKIIAEPLIPSNPESKNILIVFLLTFLISGILITSLKIIIRISGEFQV